MNVRMQIGVVTLFPDLIEAGLGSGLIGQALKSEAYSLTTVNPREFTTDAHHRVDDRPFGGGDGMVMMAEPLALSVEKLKAKMPEARVIHLSPRGKVWSHALACEWAKENRDLILIASRYAGADERFIEEFCDCEISIGDFVVSGGELPAMLVIDSVLRQREGVLGNKESSLNDSFADGLLEAPQYTRPQEWRGHEVPEILLSGDHKKLEAYQRLSSVVTTLERRPDLLNREQVRLQLSMLKRAFGAASGDVQALIEKIEKWVRS